jgi:hypothetical protein
MGTGMGSMVTIMGRKPRSHLRHPEVRAERYTASRPLPTCALENPISRKPEIGGQPPGPSSFESRLCRSPQHDGAAER